jgi:hypothetical protein
MKYEFVKEHGKLIEKIVIDNEPKWVYVQYAKGNFEKFSYTLKNNPEDTTGIIENFIEELPISEELKSDVSRFLATLNTSTESNFQAFINFLVQTLSLHLMVGVALALSIYGGYQLGTKLDARLDIYPGFTIIGIFLGIAIGSMVGYLMMLKYLGTHGEKGKIPPVKIGMKKKPETGDWPVIAVTLSDIREAVRLFAAYLPKGINRTILIKDDYSIDFEQLAPYLGGIPDRPFYMSKETFIIYEELEKDIPPLLDKVQKAVNLFYKVNKTYPIRPYDPLYRVNYHQLLQGHYLDGMPPIDFYFTDYDGLITNQKPEKKLVGG